MPWINWTYSPIWQFRSHLRHYLRPRIQQFSGHPFHTLIPVRSVHKTTLLDVLYVHTYTLCSESDGVLSTSFGLCPVVVGLVSFKLRFGPDYLGPFFFQFPSGPILYTSCRFGQLPFSPLTFRKLLELFVILYNVFGQLLIGLLQCHMHIVQMPICVVSCRSGQLLFDSLLFGQLPFHQLTLRPIAIGTPYWAIAID